jgi:uncharacterized protein involved in exopolysaccharide biosynthesis
MRDTNATLETTITLHLSTISDLETTKATLDKTIADLIATNIKAKAAKSNRIKNRNATIAKQLTQITQLTTSNTSKDAKIANLDSQLAQARNLITTFAAKAEEASMIAAEENRLAEENKRLREKE